MENNNALNESILNIDSIMGLDDEEEKKEFVYIAHEKKPTMKFKFNLENVKKSNFITTILVNDTTVVNSENPILIKIGGLPEFMFIIKYLDFYNNLIIEVEPPEIPLVRDKQISEIFEFEYIIFKDIFDMEDNTERLLFLRKIIHLLNYLDMEKLSYKICAIVAYYMILLQTPEERIQLEKVLKESSI